MIDSFGFPTWLSAAVGFCGNPQPESASSFFPPPARVDPSLLDQPFLTAMLVAIATVCTWWVLRMLRTGKGGAKPLIGLFTVAATVAAILGLPMLESLQTTSLTGSQFGASYFALAGNFSLYLIAGVLALSACLVTSWLRPHRRLPLVLALLVAGYWLLLAVGWFYVVYLLNLC